MTTEEGLICGVKEGKRENFSGFVGKKEGKSELGRWLNFQGFTISHGQIPWLICGKNKFQLN